MPRLSCIPVVCCLGLCLALPLRAQISPGKLSRAHQAYEGMTKCGSCHALGAGAPRFKCLSCHAEIRARLDAKRGFHATVVKRDGGTKQECVRCHSDHYGDSFRIVKWEPSRDDFDHRRTGYSLEGRHAGLECSRCHQPQHIAKAELASIRARDKKQTYLGLSTQCSSCHADEHRGQFGAGCARCHNSFNTWKQPALFDHSAARFRLTGLHEKVACAGCHKPVSGDGKTYIRYKEVAFGSCADCHRDPHRAAFAGSCQGCHTDNGWKQVKMQETFDHSTTRFPLRGLHAKVACLDCHKSANFKEPVAHGQCRDCHQRDDPHKGQFAAEDCGSCHSETGYKPSTFDVSRHQRSRYPLVAKHAVVECARCHTPAGREANYHPAHEACGECHKDAHGGQFAAAPYKNHCERCHTEAGFRPSTFTLSKHQETGFRLTGGHAATACMDCHKPPAGIFPAPPATFHFADRSCTGCHADPHRGQFEGSGRIGCETCHTTRAWTQVGQFDHETTGFTLSGAHRAVECTGCHHPANLGVSMRQVVFRGAPVKCAGCHEDIHGGQFAVSGSSDCASCHAELAWKPAHFDHESRTRFSLAGAHRAVPCRSCHTHSEEIAGRPVLLYRAAPSQCAACHKDQ